MELSERNRSRLRCALIPGVGRKTIRLIEEYLNKNRKDWDYFWGLDCNKLIDVCKSKKIAEKIKYYDNEYINMEINSLTNSDDLWILFDDEEAFPKSLLSIDDPPILLFGRGKRCILQDPSIAIIGTRRMSSYGAFATRKITKELVGLNVTIVSGAMYGVDAESQMEVIRNNGRTIGVLGYGLHAVPSSSRKLIETIVRSGGCVISEYVPKVLPSKGTFPERNRIIAGIALGIVVIEAAMKSGTHITVHAGLEAGKTIFAVPGSITNPFSEGTNWLLRQGAIPITSGEDIVKEFQDAFGIASPLAMFEMNQQGDDQDAHILNENELLQQQVYDAIKSGISDVDQLMSTLSITTSLLLQYLTELEVQGKIERLGLDWFVKINRQVSAKGW